MPGALRILGEALSNAVKRARASRIEVHADRRDGRLLFAVVDDGVGFRSSARVLNHYGLSGMASRARKLGARLHLDSAPACRDYGPR
ncbi:MAG TPA: ATP-binding protein [Xanthomonadales bacterium]|nr:ATP-binding protein [Xanthomonadales bacterium]